MSSIKTEQEQQIKRRRTFAIISHPDAGKTTLTEKLLLYGGAINLAGSVKSRKASRHAVSDWMEIEKQRGISVTSSVMQFEYNNFCINILDTPGHQDFSEDTYRTLVAADSAVMLIDGAKGVEPQTIKLFHVCKMRGIPIFTFVNKMDRAIKNPFDLMQEIEDVLGIRSCPLNWPIGTDGDFKGVYNRKLKQIELFTGGKHGQSVVESSKGSVEDLIFKDLLGEPYYSRLVEEIELLNEAGDDFNLNDVLKGNLTPIFFGSAMTNFGVEPFLETFLSMAPHPDERVFTDVIAQPYDDDFLGFIFKIQANMNPNHRDRIAFLRICSGKFKKGMEVYISNSNKPIRLAQPQHFMAQEREIVEEAWPGDIVGLFDPGIFRIGDTLSSKNPAPFFDGIPLFPSEHFVKVSAKDTMKRKQFLKGIRQLSEEGAVQVYKQLDIGIEEFIVGAVGVLQFEVLEHRLKNEYNVLLRLNSLPHKFARWLIADDIDAHKLNLTSSTILAEDKFGKTVLLFENQWSIDWAKDKNKGIELSDVSIT
ncbi:MAG: peptide chain release factor 3 [Ruminiclostridium sp.]|nr:peptide chain release factor 3 [Ruminiclostridium sp.]